MKNIILSLFLVLSVLSYAQSYEVSKTNGVVTIQNNLNGVINEYTESAKLISYISSGRSNKNTINIVTATGYKALEHKGYSDSIEVGGVSYSSNYDLIEGLNALFSSLANVNTPYQLDAAKGNVNKTSIMSAIGEYEGGEVDVNGEDVCRSKEVGGSARLPTPSSSGEQMTIISTSAQDKLTTGTGVWQIKIHYIQAVTGKDTFEIVNMNGTTAVNTVATDIMFVNDMYSIVVNGTGIAGGNITCYKTGGSIANDLYNFIIAGGNKSLVPHRMIPKDHTLYLQSWHASEAGNKRSAFRIRSTDMYGELLEGVFCFKDVAYIKLSSTGMLPIYSAVVPELSIIKVSHWDDQSGSEGSCGWWGYLVKD